MNPCHPQTCSRRLAHHSSRRLLSRLRLHGEALRETNSRSMRCPLSLLQIGLARTRAPLIKRLFLAHLLETGLGHTHTRKLFTRPQTSTRRKPSSGALSRHSQVRVAMGEEVMAPMGERVLEAVLAYRPRQQSGPRSLCSSPR